MSITRANLRERAEVALAEISTKELTDFAALAQHAAEVVALRLTDHLSFKEIAAKLGIPVETVELRLVQARELGILSTTDEVAGMMKTRLVPKALDVLQYHLSLDSEDSAIATLKGTGVLVSHQRSQATSEVNTTLRVVMETRDGSPIQRLDPLTMTGQIVGVGNPDDEEASVIRKGI